MKITLTLDHKHCLLKTEGCLRASIILWFTLIHTITCQQWNQYSSEFAIGDTKVDSSWTQSGGGQLTVSGNLGCPNPNLGYDFYETKIVKKLSKFPINKSIRISYLVQTYGFDSNEWCTMYLNSVQIKKYDMIANYGVPDTGDYRCSMPLTIEDPSGSSSFFFSMECGGTRNLFWPEVWEYQCKRIGCDNCTDTQECICNNPRMISPQSNTCVDLCQDGFILGSSNATPCAQVCPSWCKQCNSQLTTECFQCAQSNQYITIIDKVCGDCQVDEIPVGIYCTKCDISCASCSGVNSNQCLQCKQIGYYIQSFNNNLCGTCDTQNGYFIDGQICRKCDPTCKKCTGVNSNQCTACYQQRFLNTSTCDLCHTDCKYCVGNQQVQCTQCLNPAFNIGWDNQICRSCKSNEFIENYFCKLCPPTCASCTSLTNCTSCIAGQSFQYSAYKMCGICATNEYVDIPTNQCRKCDSSCATCTAALNVNCKSCVTPNYFINNINLCGLCDLIYYGDTISNRCISCHPDCKPCNGPNNTDCLACRNPSDYFCQNNPKCQKKCISCYAGCGECFGSEMNQCTKCVIGILQPDNSCQKKCPSRQYYVEENNSCQDCISDCLSCSNNYLCDKCDLDNIDKSVFEYKGICMNCPINSYYDINLQNCYLCHPSCLQCSGPLVNNCKRCREPNFLTNDNKCVVDCPSNYIKNFQSRMCQICKYQDLVCVLDCSQGYYLVGYQCKKCLNNCSACISGDDCQECVAGYNFKYTTDQITNAKTLSCVQCTSDEYISLDKECKSCSDEIQNCSSCQIRQNTLLCLQCSFQYDILQSTQCKIKQEYANLECTTASECEKQKQLQDKLSLAFTSASIIVAPVSIASVFFSVSSGPIFWYSLQNFQILGNFIMYKDDYKEEGLGPVVMNQFYLFNLFPILPKFEFDNNTTDEGNQSSSLHRANLRNLSLFGNVLQNDDFINSNYVSMMLYWAGLLSIFLIALVISKMFGKQIRLCQRLLEQKYKVLLYYVTFFSNYQMLNTLLSLQHLDYSRLRIIDLVSCCMIAVFTLIYFFCLYKIILNIESNDSNTIFVKGVIQHKVLQKYFWLFFELKKCLCIGITVFVNDPSISAIILFPIYFIFFIYLSVFQPFVRLSSLRFFQFQELLLSITFLNLFLSYEIKSIRTLINQITISLLAIFMIAIFFLSLSMIYKMLKKLYLHIKNKTSHNVQKELAKVDLSFWKIENSFEIKKVSNQFSLNRSRQNNNQSFQMQFAEKPTQASKKNTINLLKNIKE